LNGFGAMIILFYTGLLNKTIKTLPLKLIMNKIKKLFKATGLLIRKPYLLNKVIDDNDAWRDRLEDKFSNGFDEVKFKDLSPAEEIIVKPFAFLEGGSLPTDLALLRILAGSFDKCRYFEIGTWRGESVSNVATVADECMTLNLSAKQMLDMGLAKDYIDQHAMFSKKLSNVKQLDGNSLDYDFSIPEGKFDLIFIDGDHHYASIKSDTENVFRHLVHEKSIVVWHDYAWQPGNIRFETMAAILDGTPENKRDRLYAVRNTMCAVYYPATIQSNKPSVSFNNEDSFEVKIKLMS